MAACIEQWVIHWATLSSDIADSYRWMISIDSGSKRTQDCFFSYNFTMRTMKSRMINIWIAGILFCTGETIPRWPDLLILTIFSADRTSNDVKSQKNSSPLSFFLISRLKCAWMKYSWFYLLSVNERAPHDSRIQWTSVNYGSLLFSLYCKLSRSNIEEILIVTNVRAGENILDTSDLVLVWNRERMHGQCSRMSFQLTKIWCTKINTQLMNINVINLGRIVQCE
jgi:hypothetical protein